MMNKVLFIVSFSCYSLSAFCQNTTTNWEIKTNTVQYSIEDKLLYIGSYEIVNNECDYLWLYFIDKDSISDSKNDEIRNYFFSRKNGWSLFGIAMEVNIIFTPSIFSTFIKRINPNEKFTIHFMSMSGETIDQQMLNDVFFRKMKLYSEQYLVTYDKRLSFMLNPGFIFYQPDYIIIPIEKFI